MLRRDCKRPHSTIPIINSILLIMAMLAVDVHASDTLGAPDTVCQWMSEERFGGLSEYRQRGSQYRCATNRKPIDRGEPVSSDVRYLAFGSKDEILEVRLEMQMRSARQPQQVLKRFADYAEVLSIKATGKDLPEEVGPSIMSGIAGEWQQHGRTFRLRRVQDHGSRYDLHFIIR
ncbi:MAG: hypothetical protein ABW101_18945 [Candidatus Thiodiazotropha sp.]